MREGGLVLGLRGMIVMPIFLEERITLGVWEEVLVEVKRCELE